MSAQKARSKEPPSPDSAERILAAATKLFARHGYDGTTIKLICDEASVNIAAIHYHFESKEQLFKQIIERFGGERLEAVQRILLRPSSAEEVRVRLGIFLAESINAFIQQPDLCRIVQAEIELLNARTEEVFKRSFVKLFETLVDFIDHARKRGLIHKGCDARIAAQFLFNQLRQATRAEAVNSKYFGMSIREEKYRSLWMEQTLAIFLRGIGLDEASARERRK